MIKGLARSTAINAFVLFILSYAYLGVAVHGGLLVYLLGGLALALMFAILKPLLNIITFPLVVVTFGVFSFVSNVVIFYLLTVFVPNISISSFVFKGVSIAGFVIPKVGFNSLFAFILVSFLQYVIVTFISWLMK